MDENETVFNFLNKYSNGKRTSMAEKKHVIP